MFGGEAWRVLSAARAEPVVPLATHVGMKLKLASLTSPLVGGPLAVHVTHCVVPSAGGMASWMRAHAERLALSRASAKDGECNRPHSLLALCGMLADSATSVRLVMDPLDSRAVLRIVAVEPNVDAPSWARWIQVGVHPGEAKVGYEMRTPQFDAGSTLDLVSDRDAVTSWIAAQRSVCQVTSAIRSALGFLVPSLAPKTSALDELASFAARDADGDQLHIRVGAQGKVSLSPSWASSFATSHLATVTADVAAAVVRGDGSFEAGLASESAFTAARAYLYLCTTLPDTRRLELVADAELARIDPVRDAQSSLALAARAAARLEILSGVHLSLAGHSSGTVAASLSWHAPLTTGPISSLSLTLGVMTSIVSAADNLSGFGSNANGHGSHQLPLLLRAKGRATNSTAAEEFFAELTTALLAAVAVHDVEHKAVFGPLVALVEAFDVSRPLHARMLAAMLAAMASAPSHACTVCLVPLSTELLSFVANLFCSLGDSLPLPVLGSLRSSLLQLANTLILTSPNLQSTPETAALYSAALAMVGSAKSSRVAHPAAVTLLATIGCAQPAKTRAVFDTLVDVLDEPVEPSALSMAQTLAVLDAVLAGLARLTAVSRTLRRGFVAQLQDVLFSRWFMAALSFSTPHKGDEALRKRVTAALANGLLDTHGALPDSAVALLSAFVLELASRVTELMAAATAPRPTGTPASDTSLSTSLGTFFIALLGDVAVRFGVPSVSKVVLNHYVSSLDTADDDSTFAGPIVAALTTMALAAARADSSSSVLTEILSLFSRLAQRAAPRLARAFPSALYLHVMDAFVALGNGLDSAYMRADLGARLVQIFVLLARQSLSGLTATDSASVPNNLTQSQLRAAAAPLTHLLPPIVALLSSTTPDDILFPRITTAKIYHSLWAYCVLFQMPEEGVWPAPVFESVVKLASRMPVLIAPALTHSFSEFVAELNDAILPFLPRDAPTTLTMALAAALPSVARTTLTALGTVRAFYLYAVYKLESLRSASLFIMPSFVYLEDSELATSGPLHDALKALPHVLLADFLAVLALPPAVHSSLMAQPKCPAPASGLCGCKARIEEEHAIFLAAFMAHQYKDIRHVAADILLALVRGSTALLTSVRALRFLMDLLEVLAASVNVGVSPASEIPVTLRPEELALRLPNLDHSVTLPLDLAARAAVLGNVASVASAWLSAGMQAAPAQVQAVISGMLRDFNRLAGPALPHLDGLILRVGSLTDPVLDSLVTPKASAEHARLAATSHRQQTTFGSQLVRESYHTGLVVGMVSSGVDVVSHLLAAVDAALAVPGPVPGRPAWSHDIASLTYTLAAYVVRACSSGEPVSSSVLDALTLLPVKAFTRASLEVGVSAWAWVVGSEPALDALLLARLVELWDWSQTSRLGLFAPDPEAADSVADAGPHKTWLVYLHERLTGSVASAAAVAALLHTLVTHALHDPLGLSVHPSALPARLALLDLGLKLASGAAIRRPAAGAPSLALTGASGSGELSAGSGECESQASGPAAAGQVGEVGEWSGAGVAMSSLGETGYVESPRPGPTLDVLGSLILRDVVYNGLLTWFVSHSAWFRGDDEGNHEALAQLIEFARALQSDGDVLTQLVSALEEMQGGEDATTSASVVSEFDAADAAPLVDCLPLLYSLQDRRHLALVLLASEIERLATWTNPLHMPGRAVAGANEFPIPSPADAPKLWKELVEVAWTTLPRLAVQLTKRFPAALIRRQVEALVRANAAALIDVPEAIPLLVTEASVRANAPALRLLVSWAPCEAATAVALLSWKSVPPHNLVVQYALRVLRGLPVRDVIFFIPQLVQALRADPHGYIAQFLAASAAKSSIVAHQLLWNMKTYQEKNDDGEFLDGLLGPLCTRLEETILGNFTAEQEQFYHDEWSFFEAVTQISGVLVPLKSKPEEQRQKLYDELDKIVVGEGQKLYLPSDVTQLVRGVKYRSGVCLKSAEKVPILITFAVEESDELFNEGHESESESDDDDVGDVGGQGWGESSSQASASDRGESLALSGAGGTAGGAPSLRWQGCIFKVGDDVRQDMLALQVIKLFDAQFKRIGLPVYLYPYNVVATGPGSGVIEVVANAKSRDELGRANDMPLKEYFISRYGPEDSADFAAARHEFIASTAGYSVACYLLRLVDRHSGNIMLLGSGQMVHIDFGFIGGLSSPGGDLGFERAPFKMTNEMAELMGGKNSEHFALFRELVVKAYLAVRPLAPTVVALFELLSETGLLCFKPGLLPLLLDRFKPHLSEAQAAAYASKLVDDSFDITTYLYDKLQNIQNGIAFYK
ncbi:uncharacterized protein AMSG_12411 [Thecamonas trahens ATCC 50062]|uniref:1-phosphatidylinositol 4-kinase n=1 Tax=Thecamonas trahens ATCC 50062 TaxID=461836 RepID=A0A0L0DT28_THETB|nr:hypothetical protein AMSG_12411 [Thecamonas trahens ATCC 50062]KNC55382.1 hypothetical protein AMSG_12411 [Thecamonas trahens ATCC 50062]|eukprot:XP_013753033.1 hypothetical protein AMSG_12411 [Thecamonas trahens ATCC 50062]